MNAFEEKFPREIYSTDSDQSTVDFWREKKREGWIAALNHIDNQIPGLGLEYAYEVRDYIREELEQ